MRLTVALLTPIWLAACGGVQTVSEVSQARDGEWRQRQVELDAQAIMRGMEQARQRAEQLARTGTERGAERGSPDNYLSPPSP